jgi:hypothetical protein
MSQEQRTSQLTPGAHEPKPSSSHAATKFEGTDANPGLIIGSLVIIAGTLVVAFALTVGIQKYLYDTNPQGDLPSPIAPARVVPPNPQLEVHPAESLPELRAHEEQVLNSTGKNANGNVHIPIDRAMDSVVSRLKVRPEAVPGITTPGGVGRDFSGSVITMPAPYRGPQIRGEIRKHATQ